MRAHQFTVAAVVATDTLKAVVLFFAVLDNLLCALLLELLNAGLVGEFTDDVEVVIRLESRKSRSVSECLKLKISE